MCAAANKRMVNCPIVEKRGEKEIECCQKNKRNISGHIIVGQIYICGYQAEK